MMPVNISSRASNKATSTVCTVLPFEIVRHIYQNNKLHADAVKTTDERSIDIGGQNKISLK